MDTKIKAYKAQGIGAVKVNGVVIDITEEIPSSNDLKESAALYEKEAEKIVGALKQSLCGGVLARVTSKLLHHQANLFIIPTP